jgi:hypothetical protein
MIVRTTTQYTPEFWAAHRGVPSASNFGRIITAKKGELAAAHRGYIAELIGDEFNPACGDKDDIATAAMRRGTALEPTARELYKFWAGEIDQTGFCTTDCGRFGTSPDGLVGTDGVIEFKAPLPATFVGWVLDDVLPDDYKAQCHGHLLVTGRPWCDFVAYMPDRPLFVKRVTRDAFTDRLAYCLTEFDRAYRLAREKFGLPNPTAPLAFATQPAPAANGKPGMFEVPQCR